MRSIRAIDVRTGLIAARWSQSALAMAVLLAAGTVAAASPVRAAAGAKCVAAPSSSGEWPMYGHDFSNSRSQAKENQISTTTVGGLSKAWVFSNASTGDTSAFESTPVVDGGCVFTASSAGVVYALDAATGGLVWKHPLAVGGTLNGGAIVGAPAVSGNEVIVLFNQSSTGPAAVALDRSTGDVLWQSRPVVAQAGYYTDASAVVVNGLVLFGFSPPAGDSTGQGGFALLDASTGQILKVTPTIPPDRQAQGKAGGGLWSTPAYDPNTGYAYWGSGDPYSKNAQDPNTDAILKIDLNPSNPSFGQIVAVYQGNVDQYVNSLKFLSETPICAASDNPFLPLAAGDPACAQLDLDFGASPNLFTDSTGTLLVGGLQKSGVYHAARADTMAPAWTRLVGAACQACNGASSAFDGNAIDGVGTPGGQMFSLARDSGTVDWVNPLASAPQYESISTANGVVYTIDNYGFLDAVDAATGTTLLRHQTSTDTGAASSVPLGSNGVAVAENTVFAAVSSSGSFVNSTTDWVYGETVAAPFSGYVVAYRLGG